MRNIAYTKENIQERIDAFFVQKGSPLRSRDVLRLRSIKYGKKGLKVNQQADELGISRTTLYKWAKYLP